MAPGVTPSRHRVLLVGPRVVHLRAKFESKGYPVVAAAKGVEGMAHLDTDPCGLVMLELNLGDLTATEFLMAARQGHPRIAFLLLDDAARAGQIVKALQAGLDGYMATPPDEERLFYEVERHLARLEAAAPVADEASGFEDRAVQTAMTTIAEVDAMNAGVDPAELALAKETIKSLQADMLRFEGDALRYQAVTNVLGGVLEAPLDVDEATRLRERLGLAQVADIELMTLRSDVQGLRSQKREQDAKLEELARELRDARAAADAAAIPVEDVGLTGRVTELEQELARAERRAKELETTLSAAKGALAAAEDELEAAVLEAKASARVDLEVAEAKANELDERCGLLDAEVARLSLVAEQVAAERTNFSAALDAERAEMARARAELDGLKAELRAAADSAAGAKAKSAEDEIRRSAEQEDAIATAVDEAIERERVAAQEARTAAVTAAVAEAVTAERARLEREQKGALEVAMSAATIAAAEKARAQVDKAVADERAAADARLREAVATARAEAAAASSAATSSDAAAKLKALRDELEAQLKDARAAAQSSRERADDIELQLEEARTRTEFLEEDAARVQRDAEERIQAAELVFKKEKVRLVEEKQAAASGSQEAVIKLERFREELTRAKKTAEELLAGRDALEARAHDADARSAAAATALADAQAALDDVGRRARGAEEAIARLRETEQRQGARVAELEEGLAQAQAAADTDRDAAQRSAVLVREAEARAVALEARVDDAVKRLAGAERTLAHKADELLDLQARAAVDAEDKTRAAAAVDAAKARASELERELAQTTARQQSLDDARASLEAAVAAERAQVAGLQAALAANDAELTSAKAARGAAERALTESAQAAVAHAATEARIAVDAANAELARVRTEAQAVHAQASHAVADLQGRLQATEAERQAMHAERARMLEVIGRLEGEASTLRDQVSLTANSGHDSRAAELVLRVAELEAQVAALDPAMIATVRSLVDAVDPLRWGLGAAIDYLHPFEGNDQTLAGHVRNLRLLQATLARLDAEGGKRASG